MKIYTQIAYTYSNLNIEDKQMSDETTQEIIQILKRCEVFVGLTDDELHQISSLSSAHIKTYDVNQIVSNAGESAEYLYILVEGQVHLNLQVEFGKDDLSMEITVDTVHKGSVFGWSALVQPYAFSRTSICSKKSKILLLNGKELIELMNQDERMGYEIMRSIACVIASRLRTPNNYFWAELLKARNGIKN